MKQTAVILVLLTLSGCAPFSHGPGHARRMEYLQTHPGLSEEVRTAIENRDVTEGMSKEQVRVSLGDPDEEIDDVWLYASPYGYVVVQFENDTVSDIRRQRYYPDYPRSGYGHGHHHGQFFHHHHHPFYFPH